MNSRYPFGHTGFRNQRTKPLCDLSKRHRTDRLYLFLREFYRIFLGLGAGDYYYVKAVDFVFGIWQLAGYSTGQNTSELFYAFW